MKTRTTPAEKKLLRALFDAKSDDIRFVAFCATERGFLYGLDEKGQMWYSPSSSALGGWVRMNMTPYREKR